MAPEERTVKERDIRTLFYTHLLGVFTIVATTFVPSFFLEKFSVLETHLTWLGICSASVAALNVGFYFLIRPNPPAKRNSVSHKVSRFLKCCVYFLVSCTLFHLITVLYGAPLIESVLETFSFAVILSTYTTLPCLCVLGPNLHAWQRVFSKNGASSIWDKSLQITTLTSVAGAWLGAFPLPLDWDRPWQVWPISCTLGATSGYAAGLLVSPLWIYRNRQRLTRKGS
ncbi:phosphatidylinositol-glycan biosynthesis class F protein [Ornithorhynchus anatinus]|nr:phosphatidylinositol-glycan biosynthesis class F protein [Ornithorhynchus anatinus]